MSDILADARVWLAEEGIGERMGRTHGEECHRWHLTCLVSRLADEIARLREERRWVPVGERLPEEGVEVLWWCGELGQDMGVYVGAKKGLLIEWGSHEWVIDSECFTHWMPLPPGPEAAG